MKTLLINLLLCLTICLFFSCSGTDKRTEEDSSEIVLDSSEVSQSITTSDTSDGNIVSYTNLAQMNATCQDQFFPEPHQLLTAPPVASDFVGSSSAPITFAVGLPDTVEIKELRFAMQTNATEGTTYAVYTIITKGKQGSNTRNYFVVETEMSKNDFNACDIITARVKNSEYTIPYQDVTLDIKVYPTTTPKTGLTSIGQVQMGNLSGLDTVHQSCHGMNITEPFLLSDTPDHMSESSATNSLNTKLALGVPMNISIQNVTSSMYNVTSGGNTNGFYSIDVQLKTDANMTDSKIFLFDLSVLKVHHQSVTYFELIVTDTNGNKKKKVLKAHTEGNPFNLND